MAKKVIYVGFPYRDQRGEYYVMENILAARDRALWVWRYGGVAICPHLNTMLFGGAYGIKDEVWLEGDLEILRRCDAIWAPPAGDIIGSEGLAREIEFAVRNGITVLRGYRALRHYLSVEDKDGV